MEISRETTHGYGDIEDVIRLSQNRWPGNLELQAKYIQVAIDLIKRDNEEYVESIQIPWMVFDVDITMFYSAGMVYTYWKLIKYSDLYAVGLEKMNTNKEDVQLLFYSNPEYNQPMLHLWL